MPRAASAAKLARDRQGGAAMRKAVVAARPVSLALARMRKELRNLGATRAERRAILPGDELVSGARSSSTMAVTIDAAVVRGVAVARPDGLRPQPGSTAGTVSTTAVGRARPRFTRNGRRSRSATGSSARRTGRYVVPGRAARTGARARPAVVDRRRARHRPFDAAGPRPRFFVDGVWTFVLDELPDGQDAARWCGRSASVGRGCCSATANLVFMGSGARRHADCGSCGT